MATKSLTEQFLSKENFIRAYNRIAAKRTCGGIDNVSVENFGKRLDENIQRLIEQIKVGHYTPYPVKSVYIPKFNKENEWRELGLPTIADKIVQAALLQVVEPLAEKIFLDTSYGYRPGKGHYKAIRRVEHNLKNERRTWVAHRDIDNFFDTLNHDLLLTQFSDLIKGESLLIELVALWCRMGLVGKDGRWRNVEAGIRQGHVISPLLANLYLHPLDEFVTQFNIGWVRYADDYLIQGRSKEEVENVDVQIIDFLKNRLSLGVNNTLNPISNIENGFTFLGIYFYGEKRSIAKHKLDKIQRKITWTLSDKNSNSPEAVIQHITQMVDGWRRYYGFLNPTEQFSKIQQQLENAFITFVSKKIKNGQWDSNIPENMYFPSLIIDNDPSAGFKKMRSLWQEALKINKVQNIEVVKQKADKKVSKRRRRYYREQSLETDLVVTMPGCFIGKRSERIILRRNQQIVTEIPAIKLTGLTIGAKGTALSGDVIEFCMNKDIYIHFVDDLGRVIAVIIPPGGSSAKISLLQVTERNTEKGLHLAKMFALGKVKNQFALLKYYYKYKINHTNGFGTCFRERYTQMKNLIEEIKSLSSLIPHETFRQQLMGLEGAFANHYWAIIRNLFCDEIQFDGRKREGAKDLVNSALNYGYGILYSKVLNALIRAGLNPMAGFLHSFQDGKPVLAYDLIEEFRAMVVDRSIFTILRRGEKLQQEENGLLTPEAKRKIARSVIKRLSSEVFFQGKRLTLEDVVQEQALNMKKHIIGTFRYRPFCGRW